MNHENIELACIGLGALALLMQTVILLAIYRGVSKATKTLTQDVEEMKSAVMPVVDNTRELLARVTPKVEGTVTDLSEVTRRLREQTVSMEGAVEEILARVRLQSRRMDGMLSDTLDAVDKASAFVSETVSKPLRQLSGMVAGFKAVVESLRSPNASGRRPRVHNDRD